MDNSNPCGCDPIRMTAFLGGQRFDEARFFEFGETAVERPRAEVDTSEFPDVFDQ
jgi:hypothetical protein